MHPMCYDCNNHISDCTCFLGPLTTKPADHVDTKVPNPVKDFMEFDVTELAAYTGNRPEDGSYAAQKVTPKPTPLFKVALRGFYKSEPSMQSEKIRMIKALRTALDFGLKEAKDLAEAAPELVLIITGEQFAYLMASLESDQMGHLYRYVQIAPSELVHYRVKL